MRFLQVLFSLLPLTIGWTAVANSDESLPTGSMPANCENVRAKTANYEVFASWYVPGFTGRLTTSGERYDPRRLTAASVKMPLGSVVKVENPKNGRSVRVRINDCGPFVPGRDLDLSHGAAQRIGIVKQGIARLRMIPVKIGRDASRCVE